MKRGQQDSDFSSPARARKIPFLGTDDTLNLLDLLHDDEFKYVLEYLDVSTKGNLKQTSKDYEKRVIHLDPVMRTWKIRFGPKNWEKFGMILSKAKVKHTQDGNIQNIKLRLDFLNDDFYRSNSFRIQFLAENVINNWKNNIVHLGIMISGLEFFLLDQESKMPKLQSLSLAHLSNHSLPKDWEKPHQRDALQIVNVLLEKQKDTIEVLELNELDVSIPLELKLKGLVVHSLSSRSIVSILKTSQFTLENFECIRFGYCKEIIREDFIELESFQLKLTKFKAEMSNSYLTEAVLKSSRSTLKQLDLMAMTYSDYPSIELGEIQLLLTSFTADSVSSQNVMEVLKSSKRSLKNLSLRECFVDENEFEQSIKELELDYFKATCLTLSFTYLVLCTTKKSVKYLYIVGRFRPYDMDYIPIDEHEYISLLSAITFKNLVKLYFSCYSVKFCETMINSCKSSLRSLEFHGLMNKDWAKDNERFQIEENSLQLKELKFTLTSNHLVATIINSSNVTLEHLTLDYSYGANKSNDQGYNLLTPQKLKLKSFTATDVSINVVKKVLESSTTLFNAVELKVVEESDKMIKHNPIKLDSETTQMLNQIKSRNPFCCVKLYRENVGRS